MISIKAHQLEVVSYGTYSQNALPFLFKGDKKYCTHGEGLTNQKCHCSKIFSDYL